MELAKGNTAYNCMELTNLVVRSKRRVVGLFHILKTRAITATDANK